jgi:hypothetical protein
MSRERVRLSQKGSDYLNNRNRSPLVGAVLRSINDYSAEVLQRDENIIHVRLSEFGLPEVLIKNNEFAIHSDHLVLV